MTSVANAQSRQAIRGVATIIRNTFFKMNPQLFRKDNPFFDIVGAIEYLNSIGVLTLRIVSDADWTEGNDTHALYDCITNEIILKESVYSGACEGKGRDRFTLAHEFGHFVLINILGNKLCRTDKKIQRYEDPEWQADCFAGELLVSKSLCKNMTVQQIMQNCGVSGPAANYQLNAMNRERH